MIDQYENDYNRELALISAGVATFKGIDPAPFEAQVTKCAEILQALLALGEPVPVDMAEKTAEAVAVLRQGYATTVTYCEAQLDLPEILRERPTAELEATLADAEMWVTIIDQISPPEGG